MREVPVTYIVSSEEPTRPDTSGDERLARSLQQEETMRAEKRSSRAAAAPGRPPRPPPPTAPPLPQEAGWAADWWRQQPCGGVDVDLVGQEESGDEGSDGLGDGRQRRPRYDEQQAAAAAEQQRQQQRQRAAQEEEDEALAQRLYEQELRQLSGEDRGGEKNSH